MPPDRPAPDRPDRPDRYAAAVADRRRELRDLRARAGDGHRSALRDALAVARTETATAAAAVLGALRREAGAHLAGAAPRALVALLPPAARAAQDAVHREWVRHARAAVRRTAAERGLRVPAGWPVPAPPAPADLPPAPPRARLAWTLAEPVVWRAAALPLVVAAPAVALGWAHTGPPLLLPVAGAAVLVLVAVVRRRRAAAERDRLARWVDDVLAAARSGLDTGPAATVLAADAAAHLDALLARHRAALDAELDLLTTGAPGDRA